MKRIAALILFLVIFSLLGVAAVAEELHSAPVAAESKNRSEISKDISRSEQRFAMRDEADFRTLATNTARSSALFLGGLLVVFGIWKRWNAAKNPEGGLIQLIARRQLTPRSSLFVAEVDGRRFLLAENPESITFLSELDNLPTTDSSTKGFNELLSNSFSLDSHEQGKGAAVSNLPS